MQSEQDRTEDLDFERGLSVSEKSGHEFASAGSAGMAYSFVGTQVFASFMLVPMLSFFVLRNWVGISSLLAGVVTGVVGVVFFVMGLAVLIRLNGGMNSSTNGPGAFFKNESDSRFRVRAVIPKKQQSSKLMQWAQVAAEGELTSEEPVKESELAMIQGGFEPIIVRPWFGVKHTKHYWWSAVITGLVCAGCLIILLSTLFGGLKGVLDISGLFAYGMTGLCMLVGAYSAEFMWPVYVRLVPGQLDIFRYGFLGSGKPKVESFDLHKVGVCANFGQYLMSIEPTRPVGEPLPGLVLSKKWPHGQCFPEDFKPTYFSVAMVRGRREFVQRFVQAARTDEPTPPVSMDRLGE